MSASELHELQMFTPEDVAGLLRVSRSQVYALIKRGELGSVHIGTSVRVLPEQLSTFIAARQAECGDDEPEGRAAGEEPQDAAQPISRPARRPRRKTTKKLAPAR